MSGLAKLADLKERLGISGTEQDSLLNACLDEAAALVEQECKRTIRYVDADVVEQLDGDYRSGELRLRAWPVIAGSVTVKIAADRDFASATAEIEGEDYYVRLNRGVVQRLPQHCPWPEGVANVQVTYRGGHLDPDAAPIEGVSTPPSNIQRANLIAAVAAFNRRKEPDAHSETLPGGTGAVASQKDYGLPQAAKDLLVGERRI